MNLKMINNVAEAMKQADAAHRDMFGAPLTNWGELAQIAVSAMTLPRLEAANESMRDTPYCTPATLGSLTRSVEDIRLILLDMGAVDAAARYMLTAFAEDVAWTPEQSEAYENMAKALGEINDAGDVQ